MALVGGELAPAVTVQQVVDRGQRHGTAQGCLQFAFDLADHQDATSAGAIEKGGQYSALLLDRHVLAPPPAARGALSIASDLAGQEAIAQAVSQATASWIESLERKNQRKTKLYAMAP